MGGYIRGVLQVTLEVDKDGSSGEMQFSKAFESEPELCQQARILLQKMKTRQRSLPGGPVHAMSRRPDFQKANLYRTQVRRSTKPVQHPSGKIYPMGQPGKELYPSSQWLESDFSNTTDSHSTRQDSTSSSSKATSSNQYNCISSTRKAGSSSQNSRHLPIAEVNKSAQARRGLMLRSETTGTYLRSRQAGCDRRAARPQMGRDGRNEKEIDAERDEQQPRSPRLAQHHAGGITDPGRRG